MDLNAIPVFVAVVRARSFSAAARSLKMPISTVSTKITLLERELSVVLLTRTTRQLHLTEAGELFFEYAERALAEVTEAETLATSAQDKVQGLIRVTSTVELGSNSVSQLLAKFLTLYPEIQIELILTDKLVDVIRERIDLAVRIGELDDSSLVSKRLGYVERKAYATPLYLERNGTPRQVPELANHSFLAFQEPLETVIHLKKKGETRNVKVKSRFVVNNLVALKNLTLGDAGIGFLPVHMCKEEVALKRLVPVLDGWSMEPIPVQLIHARQKFLPRRVRLLHSFLIDHLKNVY